MRYNFSVEKIKIIGQKIKESRLSKNLRMDDVAKAVGITRATLSSIENGSGNCSILVLLKLFEFLNLDIAITDEKIELDRKRATRLNKKEDKKINRFIVMCVEQYAHSANKDSQSAYAEMAKYGIIEDLTNDYEDLHGMSTVYLNDYINKIVKRGEV